MTPDHPPPNPVPAMLSSSGKEDYTQIFTANEVLSTPQEKQNASSSYTMVADSNAEASKPATTVKKAYVTNEPNIIEVNQVYS